MLTEFADEYYRYNGLGTVRYSMRTKLKSIQKIYDSGRTPTFNNVDNTRISIAQVIFEKYKKQKEDANYVNKAKSSDGCH